jgi:hypothetical protein
MEIIQFIRRFHPEYTAVIVELTPEQKLNTLLYHTSTHDLVSHRFSFKIVKVFMTGSRRSVTAENTTSTTIYASTMALF